MTADDGDRSGSEDASLTLDAVLDILSHHQRRDLLRLFHDSSTRTVDFEECVSHLLERERRRMGKVPGPDHLRITLRHVHLPKLGEMGLVTYDESAETLRYHPNDSVESWLDLIDSERDTEE